MRPGEFKILAALMENPEGLTYTKLRDKTNLSNPVLSEYLARFKNEGVVFPTIDRKSQTSKNKQNKERSRYVLAGAYLGKESLPSDFEQKVSALMAAIPFESLRISRVKDPDRRQKIFSDFLEYHTGNIRALILLSIMKSVKASLEEPSWSEDAALFEKIAKSGKKKARVQGKEFLDHWEQRLSLYHSALQEKLVNWVIPYVQFLALGYMGNLDSALHGFTKEIPALLLRFDKNIVEKTFWQTELEKAE
jgi:hypothetical protein